MEPEGSTVAKPRKTAEVRRLVIGCPRLVANTLLMVFLPSFLRAGYRRFIRSLEMPLEEPRCTRCAV